MKTRGYNEPIVLIYHRISLSTLYAASNARASTKVGAVGGKSEKMLAFLIQSAMKRLVS